MKNIQAWIGIMVLAALCLAFYKPNDVQYDGKHFVIAFQHPLLNVTQEPHKTRSSELTKKLTVKSTTAKTTSSTSTVTVNDKPILLLSWNKGYDRYVFNEGNHDFLTCPQTKCQVTHNRSLVDKADAVMFHGMHMDMGDVKQLESIRNSSKAIFIFHVNESPTMTNSLGEWANDFFDMTMTYRRDSDIFHALYQIVPKSVTPPVEMQGKWLQPTFGHLTNTSYYTTGKTKLAAWLVSKCSTNGKREYYVKHLKRFMPVDTFGRCASRPLPMTVGNKNVVDSRVDIYADLLEPYFFYLSFENTRCRYYITEKFYNAMSANAVPVVFGPDRSDYEAVAPAHSFIHVADFQSAEKLAKYLRYLTTNHTAYVEYFWWKKFYVVQKTRFKCNACDRLHQIKNGIFRTKRIRDFNQYWKLDAQCNTQQSSPWHLLTPKHG